MTDLRRTIDGRFLELDGERLPTGERVDHGVLVGEECVRVGGRRIRESRREMAHEVGEFAAVLLRDRRDIADLIERSHNRLSMPDD